MRGDAEYRNLEEALDRLEERIGRTLSAAERKLFENLTDSLSSVRTDDGAVQQGGRPGEIVDMVFGRFDNEELPKVIRSLVNELIRVMDAGKGYFIAMGAKTVEADAATDKIISSLGLRRDKATLKLVGGGYLESITRSTAVKMKVMRAVLNASFSGGSFKDLLGELRGIVETRGKAEGELTKYYKTFAYDMIQRASSIQGERLAKAANLKCFIYSGTIIEKSRPFCKNNAGKVFTTEEAEEWKDMVGEKDGPQFSEKLEYEPIRDRGGHRCRHRVRWISNQEAIRRRPELKGLLT